jgi:ElaB/YqjD/DUF883 family membrane-anchored ribosome-binding protein
MSERDNPYSTAPGTQQSWAPADSGSDTGSDAGGVKERVTEAASQLGDAGRDAAHEAKDRAGDIAHEAADRTRGLADRTRSELGSQAASQQQHLASGLRSLGDELGQMAGRSDSSGFASELVQRTGDATGRAAQWIEDREPGDILREVEDFARRRPGTFIAIAAGAGLVVGRLLRGMRDAPDREGAPDRSPDSGAASDRGPERSATPREPVREPAVGGAAEDFASRGTPPPGYPSTVPPATPDRTTGGETFVERT